MVVSSTKFDVASLFDFKPHLSICEFITEVGSNFEVALFKFFAILLSVRGAIVCLDQY